MIARVTAPHIFQSSKFKCLAERACIDCGIPPMEGTAHIESLCGHWTSCVIIGLDEEQEPVGLLIVELPNPFTLRPVVSLAYNNGGMEVGKEMFTAARQYITSAGYTQVDMLNRSRMRTDVWAHGAEIRLGGKEVNRASVITLELNQDERGRE